MTLKGEITTSTPVQTRFFPKYAGSPKDATFILLTKRIGSEQI